MKHLIAALALGMAAVSAQAAIPQQHVLVVTTYESSTGTIVAFNQFGPFASYEACVSGQQMLLIDHVSLLNPHNDFSGVTAPGQWIKLRCYPTGSL